MHNRTKLLAAFAATIVAVGACEDATFVDPNLHYEGSLSGTKEKPTATTSTATGIALVSLGPTGILAYSATWNGLTGPATGAHIHGPADDVSTAGILIDFAALPNGCSGANATSYATANGSASGYVNLKCPTPVTFGTPAISGDSVIVLLKAGRLYVNVHTAANASGEIRTQVIAR